MIQKFSFLFIFVLAGICLQAQTAKDYRRLHRMIKQGKLTEQQAKEIVLKWSLDVDNEVLEDDLVSVFLDQDESMNTLFKIYLQTVGMIEAPPVEIYNVNSVESHFKNFLYVQGVGPRSPGEDPIEMLNFDLLLFDFKSIIADFIPFLVGLFANSDIPAPLAVFKWANYGKQIFRDHPELRLYFND